MFHAGWPSKHIMLAVTMFQCPTNAEAPRGHGKLFLLGCAKQVCSLRQVTLQWHRKCQAFSATCWAAGHVHISALAPGSSLDLTWKPSLFSPTMNDQLSTIADMPAQQKCTRISRSRAVVTRQWPPSAGHSQICSWMQSHAVMLTTQEHVMILGHITAMPLSQLAACPCTPTLTTPGMNSLGTAPPLISDTNSKPEPGSPGSKRICTSANWPEPPDCFLWM